MTTTTATLSPEHLQFHLVWNKDFGLNHDNTPIPMEEWVWFLIDSLQAADKATATKAENLLIRIGKPALPALMQGLGSPYNRVKSICAMALIRIGQPAVANLQELYLDSITQPNLRWVIEFILNELGRQIPILELSPELSEEQRTFKSDVKGKERKVLPFVKTAV